MINIPGFQFLPSKYMANTAALLTTLFISVAVVAVLLVSAVQMSLNYQAQQALLVARQTRLAEQGAVGVEHLIEQLFITLETGAAIGNLSGQGQLQPVDQLFALQPAFLEIKVLDQTGQSVRQQTRSQAPGRPAMNQIDSEALLIARQTGRYISPVRFDEAAATALVTMAVPRFNRTSDFEGLLVAEVDLQPLTALLAGLQADQTGTAYLVDTTGQFIVGSDSGLIQLGEDLSSLPLVRDYLQQSRTTAPQLLTGLHGEAAVGRYAALDFPEWALIVELPAAEAYGAMRLSLALAVGSTVLIVLLITWLSIYLARQTAAPLATLTQRADRVVDGRFNQIMPVVGTTEIKRLANAFNRMTLQVRELIQTLEERVAMRTQRLEMITTISSQLSTILSLDDLLLEVVERIQTSFNFYHAHIYFMDDQQQRLMVVAGTGTAGARMKADRHSIPLNAPTSLVARAARTGQVVWVNNVRERADWLPNELLPNTRAEMAVPILLGDQVVGVLDVQQDTVGGLDDSDASLLRSLANHVAVAIRNARLFAEVEAALAEAKMAQSHYLQQAWHPSNQVNAPISGEYHGRGQSPLSDIVLDQLEQAAHRQAGPVVLDAAAEPSEMGQQALIAPIKLHGLTIGTMQFYDVAGERSWDERELALIDVIAGQVAQAAENIRLIEEMRERSSRERTIREFTDKLRATPNLDALLSTATRELAERLNVRHAVMEIGIE